MVILGVGQQLGEAQINNGDKKYLLQLQNCPCVCGFLMKCTANQCSQELCAVFNHVTTECYHWNKGVFTAYVQYKCFLKSLNSPPLQCINGGAVHWWQALNWKPSHSCDMQTDSKLPCLFLPPPLLRHLTSPRSSLHPCILSIPSSSTSSCPPTCHTDLKASGYI